jgi:hypothetical protein
MGASAEERGGSGRVMSFLRLMDGMLTLVTLTLTSDK